MASNLIAHTGSKFVTRQYLAELPAPRQMGVWHRPIPHIELIDSVLKASRNVGLELRREQFASQADGQILFAVFDFERTTENGDAGWSMGLRSSTNERFAIEIVGGLSVFVCDNLAFRGDSIILHRKSTRRLDLEEQVGEGLQGYARHMGELERLVAGMRATVLEREEIQAKLFRVFSSRSLPAKLLHIVADYVFNPSESWEDVLGYDGCPICLDDFCDGGKRIHSTPQPRTRLLFRPRQTERSLWGLHNACTRAVKALPPASMLRATQRLGKLFGMVSEN